MKLLVQSMALVAVIGLVAFFASGYIDPGLLYLLSEALLLLFMAQMWNLLAGYGGMVSMGHQAFVGLGAYLFFALANFGVLPVGAALPVAALAVGLMALPLGLLLFRLRNAYFSVAIWVVAEILVILFSKFSALGGTGGMTLRPDGGNLDLPLEQYVFAIALFSCVGFTLAMRWVLARPTGLAILAVRDNEDAAQAAGVNVQKLHLALFAISAAGCAWAGSLYYANVLYLTPTDAFQINWVIGMMFIAVVGGIGTLTGPVIGTVIFISLRELLTSFGFSGSIYWIVMGLIVIVTLVYAPRGLWPALHTLFRRMSIERKSA
ncbi:branched-chain amino acid ABC transporter permease [Agrobacterium vitis]